MGLAGLAGRVNLSSAKQLSRIIIFFCFGTNIILSYLLWYKPHFSNRRVKPKHRDVLDPILSPAYSTNHSSFLGVASDIFVISLPHRVDRRDDMESLRSILGLTWQYSEGVQAHSPLVQMISEHVRLLRIKEQLTPSAFSWPESIENITMSTDPILPSGSDVWLQSLLTWTPHQPPLDRTVPLTCSTKNNTLRPYNRRVGPRDLLTSSTIACWESHLRVIRHIANSAAEGPAIILEDDVDMEYDIRERLVQLWPSLPSEWDVVFLGHCWSNEGALPAVDPEPADDAVNVNRLHPSSHPKCTHAYALSRRGARRILQHLVYIPFAYSRAIDQALSWLISSGRIKSFSVVPSLVIQRRKSYSDVSSGRGSRWRDQLYRGVFGPPDDEYRQYIA